MFIDRLKRLLMLKGKLSLEGAVQFNDFEGRDQEAVLFVCEVKTNNGELQDFYRNPVKAIEEVSRLYHLQKCAFQDALTRDGFDIVPESEIVQKNYPGRIAFLTTYGTFSVLGKPVLAGRLISMKRIHSPSLDKNLKRGYLERDLKLGESPSLAVYNSNGYNGSNLRGLAINQNGSIEPELEVEEHYDATINFTDTLKRLSRHRPNLRR